MAATSPVTLPEHDGFTWADRANGLPAVSDETRALLAGRG